MSRSFLTASSQFLLSGTAAVTAVPITVSVWYYPTNVSTNQELFCIGDNSGATVNDAIRMECNFAAGTNKMQFVQRHLTSETSMASGITVPSINTWSNIIGTIGANPNSPQTIYLNGTLVATVVNGMGVPTGLANTSIGAFYFGGGTPFIGNYVNGNIAEVGVWNVVLSAGEIAALNAGALPYTIRSASLVAYYPLNGLRSPEPDLSGSVHNMVLQNGPTIGAGPPVMMFTPRWPQVLAAGAPPPSAIFRRTLSPIGTRIGSRQAVQ